MNEKLTAVVSPRSMGGVSLFEMDQPVEGETANAFRSSDADLADSISKLKEMGFEITSSSEATISIAGDKELFEKVLGKAIVEKKTDRADSAIESVAPEGETYFDTEEDLPEAKTANIAQTFDGLIEGIALSIPPTYFSETALPPLAAVHANAYRYLFVPDEVSVLLRAAQVHRRGITGRGVVVAMPDSGFYKHEFYKQRGYRTRATILAGGASDPDHDTVGHGTGEAANIFATAPDIELQPVKMGDAIDAIKKSVAAGAQIITNSWGYNIDTGGITWATLHPYFKALAVEIQIAINRGVTVCFSAGNGHFGFPASMPDVIAVGGVHLNYPSMTFEASSYVSSFASSIFPGREVPDFCGLTGKAVNINGVKAPSLMLPVQENADLDGIDPTTGGSDDSWGLFSGTSAACPQIAGLCALLLQADSWKSPTDVKSALRARCRDVVGGTTQQGDTAALGPDLATGAGLATAI